MYSIWAENMITKKNIPAISSFDKDAEMAEFLGALSGDGFIGNYGERKQQFMIQLTGHIDEKEYLKFLEKIISRRFRNLNFGYRKKNKTLRLTIYSREFFLFLKDNFGFPVGKKGDNLTIPLKFKKEDKLIRPFIRGLFDTDGCLFLDKRKAYKKPYPRLQLEITSQKLFKEVADYLSRYFRVHTKKRIRYNKYVIYLLELYGYEQLNKWLEMIGFSNKKHLDKVPL